MKRITQAIVPFAVGVILTISVPNGHSEGTYEDGVTEMCESLGGDRVPDEWCLFPEKIDIQLYDLAESKGRI